MTPWFLSRCELEYNASHGPDVHRTVPTTGIILDDFGRHVHRGARQPAAQGDTEPATEEAFCRATRSHHRTMVPREYLGRPEVNELYHSEVVQ